MLLGSIATVLAGVTAPSAVVTLIWVGLAAITITLVVMMRTRWGQTEPLHKCVVLSLLAHLLFVAYATTVHIVGSPHGIVESTITLVSIGDGDPVSMPATEEETETAPESETQFPWDEFAEVATAEPETAPVDPIEPPAEPKPEPLETTAKAEAEPELKLEPSPIEASNVESSIVDSLSDLPWKLVNSPAAATRLPAAAAEPIETPAPVQADAPLSAPAPAPPSPAPLVAESAPSDSAPKSDTPPPSAPAGPARVVEAPTIDVGEVPSATTDAIGSEPSPLTSDAEAPLVAVRRPTGTTPLGGSAASPSAATTPPLPSASALAGSPLAAEPLPSSITAGGDPLLPLGASGAHSAAEVYSLRSAQNRGELVAQLGGSAETEAGVNAALEWLAKHQESDGRWSAARFGAGREQQTLGHNRGGAGAKADTAVTGLAILAFLGAGQTHKEGNYKDCLDRALTFLTRSQAADGNLGGSAETFAFMYSHGMATLAIAEAYAMTHDERLAPSVRRAIAYTLSAQHPTTGGWRYRPGDLGDTSQLGWQLMSLRSAELGGVAVPATARSGMIRYLDSVSTGNTGGLAGYRPGERPTPTMTAEALVCRQFLDLPGTRKLGVEASQSIVGELPGTGLTNHYYWYYATIALYQLQGEAWDQWNEALKKTLLGSQRLSGDPAGSWDPDQVWGGYGGRVYSTALAALSLEVYYRYLPLYAEAASLKQRLK